MQRLASHLTFLVCPVFTVQGCSTSHLFSNLKRSHPRSPPKTTILPSSSDKISIPKLIHSIDQFISKNKNPILGILALFFRWIITRGYYAERNNKQIVNLSEEELGVIKTIKVCASFMWERYRPGRNVVRLEDWRE